MRDICFWFDKPAFAFEGILLQATSMYSKGRVFSFCKSEVDADRCGINSGSATKYIFCHGKSVRELLSQNNIDAKNTIHVVNGFFSFALDELCLLRSTCPFKIVCLTEPVSCMSRLPKLEYLYKLAKYNNRKRDVVKFIDAVIFLGQNGPKLFKTIRWNFKYLEISYMPQLNSSIIQRPVSVDSSGRFLYIGRNNLREKGLNYIIKWFGKNKNQKLIIIGNYGKDYKRIKKAVKKHPNIEQVESMNMRLLFDFIISNNVKCILTPSLVDGCNVNNYLSIASGTPCITTFNSNNYEMIQKANSGFVIRHTYKEFEKIMDNFTHLRNDKVHDLSTNALLYSRERNAFNEAKRMLEFISTI